MHNTINFILNTTFKHFSLTSKYKSKEAENFLIPNFTFLLIHLTKIFMLKTFARFGSKYCACKIFSMKMKYLKPVSFHLPMTLRVQFVVSFCLFTQSSWCCCCLLNFLGMEKNKMEIFESLTPLKAKNSIE